MLLSDGTAWTLIDVSNTIVAQQADNISITSISGMSATDVQEALEELYDEKADKAGDTFTGDITLDGADLIYDTGSFNTTVTATTATAARTITYPDASGTVLLAGNASIVNADISASAAIGYSKLASLTSGQIIVGSSGNVPTATAVTGDVTISNAGVTSIAAGAIVNADINATAAIAFSKLAALNSGNILVGNSSNAAASVPMTGDVTISNAGVTTVVSGTTSTAGKVQLSTATNSTSTTLAATPSAVKSAYDLAAAALPKAGGTMTGEVVLDEIKETVYTLGVSGTISLDPANGSIQTSVLTGAPTFTDSLESGQTVVLMLENGASYSVTWPTITWVTSNGNVAPTLTAKDTLVLWKIATTLYGAYVGSYV